MHGIDMGLPGMPQHMSILNQEVHAKIKFSPLENLPKLAEESGMATTEQLEWLYSAIAKLHPLDKAIILMWLDELSYNDIADNIGIPRNTVATRLHRIRKKLSEFK